MDLQGHQQDGKVFSAEQHEELLLRARAARAEAQRLATELMVLRARFERSIDTPRQLEDMTEATRRATSFYASLVRQLDWTPEAVVVDVKDMVREIPRDLPEHAQSVSRDVVSWSIVAYYGKDR